MKLVFLGTSAVFPTKERNHTAVALDIGREMFLFDCGEGTQRQVAIARLSPMKISKVFITHWHGDHVLGLAGLLQSFAMNSRLKPLDIYGPEGTKTRFYHLLKSYEMKFPFRINIHEVKSKKVVETEDYEIYAEKMQHRIPCLAYSFKEKDKVRINKNYLAKFGLRSHPIIRKLLKGKDITWKGRKIKAKLATRIKKGRKITYVVDAKATDKVAKFAKDSDIFICEATFMHAMKEVAAERGHVTAKQAGKLAKKAKVKQLILTHFSQRYKDVQQVLNEAKKQFKNTTAAKDFMEVKF